MNISFRSPVFDHFNFSLWIPLIFHVNSFAIYDCEVKGKFGPRENQQWEFPVDVQGYQRLSWVPEVTTMSLEPDGLWVVAETRD